MWVTVRDNDVLVRGLEAFYNYYQLITYIYACWYYFVFNFMIALMKKWIPKNIQ